MPGALLYRSFLPFLMCNTSLTNLHRQWGFFRGDSSVPFPPLGEERPAPSFCLPPEENAGKKAPFPAEKCGWRAAEIILCHPEKCLSHGVLHSFHRVIHTVMSTWIFPEKSRSFHRQAALSHPPGGTEAAGGDTSFGHRRFLAVAFSDGAC